MLHSVREFSKEYASSQIATLTVTHSEGSISDSVQANFRACIQILGSSEGVFCISV